MQAGFGFESMGTPNGDRASLERLAEENNGRERRLWESKMVQSHGQAWLDKYKAREAANNAAK